MSEEAVPRAVALDTSVQIDRCKMPGRRERIAADLGTLKGNDHSLSTGISLLEFKAVLIQELITIHNRLRRKGARFTRTRDAHLEKDHRQQSLRAHIFNNLLGIVRGDADAGRDERAAEKARLLLETTIPTAYSWFKEDSADTYLNRKAIDCTRADEAPSKKGRAFDTNLPKCKVGKNRYCRVEEVIRESSSRLCIAPIGTRICLREI